MAEIERHPSARRRHGQAGPTEKMREYLEVIYYLSARREPVIGVRLEHALSPTMEARIEALVGHSTTCPHGNPIPGSGAGYAGNVRLDRAHAGEFFVLMRIVEEAEEDLELMRYLQVNGLTPGTRF